MGAMAKLLESFTRERKGLAFLDDLRVDFLRSEQHKRDSQIGAEWVLRGMLLGVTLFVVGSFILTLVLKR